MARPDFPIPPPTSTTNAPAGSDAQSNAASPSAGTFTHRRMRVNFKFNCPKSLTPKHHIRRLQIRRPRHRDVEAPQTMCILRPGHDLPHRLADAEGARHGGGVGFTGEPVVGVGDGLPDLGGGFEGFVGAGMRKGWISEGGGTNKGAYMKAQIAEMPLVPSYLFSGLPSVRRAWKGRAQGLAQPESPCSTFRCRSYWRCGCWQKRQGKPRGR